jgi:hypothetical protein
VARWILLPTMLTDQRHEGESTEVFGVQLAAVASEPK